MADSLERIEQLRRRLVSDVAHELRTPLTNMRGYLEALRDEVVERHVEVRSFASLLR
ncbi:Signal transduction histidine-protein kinase BaeS [Methylobacterium crusticola]|uniref:histidine kinase n=2 Tax=Methylobacterium crusticola TaxID=1697972 RepID=A0ABQ4R8Q1_9HYPH|nr:Signal transduction histidine-protein kinase BaeS [Methylobacterium crusticola]